MTAYALWIVLMLGSQVGAANDTYPILGSQQSGTTNAAAGTASGAAVTPMVAPPPAASTPPVSVEPQRGSGDPYGPQGQVGDSERGSLLPGGSNPPPPASGASPPPFSDLLGQPESSDSVAAPTSPATRLKPSAMMRAMLTAPRNAQLSGNSVTLIEVVAGAPSRAEQAQRVDAYWDLCSSVADYYLGLREQEELRRMESIAPPTGGAWQQAESELAVRIGTAQRAARASQLRLASSLGRGADNLPLPADMPHCGSYHSRFDEIFAGRLAFSAEAQELAALLPLRYAELKGAATAVTRAEEWLGIVARNDKGDGSGTLRALELWALRRRAFVQIARDYNRRIARYAELAAPGEISAERLIGMLIKSEHTSTATRSSSPAAPGDWQSSAAGTPLRTFVDDAGWEPASEERSVGGTRDDAVQPASGQSQQAPRQERSLLVPRR